MTVERMILAGVAWADVVITAAARMGAAAGLGAGIGLLGLLAARFAKKRRSGR
jgi:hypothetical protein